MQNLKENWLMAWKMTLRIFLESDPKKSSFLRKIRFLWDKIDLKQSVEGTLKL